MRFASLGSGSKGNGTLIECEGTSILVDCGFSLKQTEIRLARLERTIGDLDAILVTHEHSDHIHGVRTLSRRAGIPIWMSSGTAQQVERRHGMFDALHIICGHEPFMIGAIEVSPFHVPHDAQEPIQYTFRSGQRRLGLLTDVGEITPHIERQLSGCDALLLECNHDLELLQRGPYPAALKRRVSGRLGHLNNDQAAGLLQRVDTSRLQQLALMHISEQNNCEERAINTICGALGCDAEWLTVADQDEGFGWRTVA